MSRRSQLVEYIIQDVIAFIIEEKHMELDIAMNSFYNSRVFEKLMDEETGLYLESSSYIYELFTAELKHGKLIQNEI
jgi:hypothetical protein